MAMVLAQRGQRFIKVSRHAYETLFKNKGYRIVQDDDKPKKVMTETEEPVEEGQEEEEKEKEIDSIPISEMNKEQLAEYAKEHNIDTSAARNVREARQIIQKAIRDSKM